MTDKLNTLLENIESVKKLDIKDLTGKVAVREKKSNHNHAQRLDVWCEHFSGYATFLKHAPAAKDCSDCVKFNTDECPYVKEKGE
jgi:hypothetical protein